ncbi:MAG: ABC transporter ATP-binding protein [Chloroflexota bacterium]
MIETNNLGKVFEDFTAVYDLNLSVPAGELLALLGPNGAGKTTTVRMLSSILRPTSGTAQVNNFDVITEADQVRHSIGMLTEQPGLYLRMTGLEYLVFYGRLYGMNDSDTIAKGRNLFDRFAMKGDEERRLGEYSKGMKQKVGLIRAMLHNPAVLLLDEPTSAMDPHSAKLVRDSILELRDDKRTVILCTHNLAEAEMLSDKIAIIKKGTIVADGTSSQLKQKLLGQPRMEITVNRSVNGEVKEIEKLVKVESVKEGTIRYRTENPSQINPILIRCLDELGLGTITLQEISQSLEDVYLSVVGEENGES